MQSPNRLTTWWRAPGIDAYRLEPKESLILRTRGLELVEPYSVPADILNQFLNVENAVHAEKFTCGFGFIKGAHQTHESAPSILLLRNLLSDALEAAKLAKRGSSREIKIQRICDEIKCREPIHLQGESELVLGKATYVWKPTSLRSELIQQTVLRILNQRLCRCGDVIDVRPGVDKRTLCDRCRSRHSRRLRAMSAQSPR